MKSFVSVKVSKKSFKEKSYSKKEKAPKKFL